MESTQCSTCRKTEEINAWNEIILQYCYFIPAAEVALSNDLLRQLGCLNPKKRDSKSRVASIESITCVLQPKVNVSEVVDEWKPFQVDSDVPGYNPSD